MSIFSTKDMNIRSGTVPTFLAVGFGKAAEIMGNVKATETITLQVLRKKLFDGLKRHYGAILINGDMENRHPGNLNLRIPGVESKQLIYSLQPKIAFSTGAACASGIIEPSHVLKAIGLTTEEAEHSFRISVGRNTNVTDIESAIAIIARAREGLAQHPLLEKVMR